MALPLQLLSQASFDGMRDSTDPQTGSPRKAKLLQNVYPVAEELGGGVTGRPGFTITQNTQLGSSGTRTAQRFYQFTEADGTERTMGFVDGLMYTYSWASSIWTEVTLSGVALDTSARIFCTTFEDKLIVNPNDGTNKPWMWDGTTFTSLTNAPTMYGPITVYYGKLFGIKWADRVAITWSEENDAENGYEAGGANNVWRLTQTSQEALTAIRGTNEALYYWRARSMGAIRGAVNDDFTNSGTHDALSRTVGTTSPAAIADHNEEIFFLDADGRPHVLRPGAGVRPIWEDLRNTLFQIPRGSLVNAVACNYSPVPLILLGVADSGNSEPNLFMAVQPNDVESPIGGIWRGFSAMAMDMVKNGSGVPTMLFSNLDGYVYEFGDPDEGPWNDGFQSGDVAIQHVVMGSYLGWDMRTGKQFDRTRISLRGLSDMTIVYDFSTPDVSATEVAQSVDVDAGLSQWDLSLWDEDEWSAVGVEVMADFGHSGSGRWILPRVRHEVIDERFGLNGWTVEAFITGPELIAV